MFDKHKMGDRSCWRTQGGGFFKISPCSSSSILLTMVWVILVVKGYKGKFPCCFPLAGTAVIPKRLQEFRKRGMSFSGKSLRASPLGWGCTNPAPLAHWASSQAQLLQHTPKFRIIPLCWQTAAFTHLFVVTLLETAALSNIIHKTYALHSIKYILYATCMQNVA